MTVPSMAIQPIVTKCIEYWYGRQCHEIGGRWKESPLLEASRIGDETTVYLILLLHHTGATLSPKVSDLVPNHQARNIRKRNALHCAVAGSNLTIVELLLQFNKSYCSSFSASAPSEVSEENFPLVDMLAATDVRGETPIHAAVRGGNLEIVETILSAVSDSDQNGVRKMPLEGRESKLINYQNLNGDTPLHIASEGGSSNMYLGSCGRGTVTAIPPRLILSGCIPESSTKRNDHDAITDGENSSATGQEHGIQRDQHRRGMIEILIDQGADVAVGDREGATALHRAAAEGQLDVIRVMQSRDVEAAVLLCRSRDNFGRTPYDVAVAFGHESTARRLKEMEQSLPVF